jgi:hypothetical protein
MRSKANNALTAPLVLLHTRIDKRAMKKIIFNGQMRNKLFLIVIYHSSLVKDTVNVARVCKLRNGVKKNTSISSFFNDQRWTKCAMNILRSYLNWWHNWQLKNRRCSHSLKGSHSMGDGRIFLKSCRDALLIKIYRTSLISTGSISLDSTFKLLFLHITIHSNLFYNFWPEDVVYLSNNGNL